MTSVVEIIGHYQRSIEKCINDELRLLHCIDKLNTLPVRVEHLQETGVGKTVNSLRKLEGVVGAAAKTLVAKWKAMVAADDGPPEEEYHPEYPSNGNDRNGDSKNDYHKAHHETKNDSNNHKKLESSSQEEKHHKYSSNHSIKSSSSSSSISRHHERKEENSKRHHDHNLNTKKNKHSSRGESRDIEDDRIKTKKSHGGSEKSSRNVRPTAESSEENYNAEDDEDEEKLIIDIKKEKTDDTDKKRKPESKSSESSRKPSKEKSSHHHQQQQQQQQQHHHHHHDDGYKKDTHNSECKKKREKDNEKDHHHKSKHRDKHEDNSEKKKLKTEHEASSCNKKNGEIDTKDKVNVEIRSKDKVNEESRSKDKVDREIRNKDKLDGEIRSKDKHTEKKRDASSERIRSDKNKSEKKDRKRERSSSEKRSDSSSSSSKKQKVAGIKTPHEGIDSSMGASFEEALGMIGVPSTSSSNKSKPKQVKSPKSNGQEKSISSLSASTSLFVVPSSVKVSSRSKTPPLLTSSIKLKPLDPGIALELPTISTNYKPLPVNQTVMDCVFNNKQQQPRRTMTDAEAFGAGISSKTMRTKVYSGARTGVLLQVPSLFDLCIRVLQKNIDGLEYTGGVPFDVLKPVLERATPQQLITFEDYNPYLMEDTDCLWQLHCNRMYRTQKLREYESWREMFMRCREEQEERLNMLAENIKQSQKQITMPMRKTQLAYIDNNVKAPRNIQRKQEIYGTKSKVIATPAARVAALSNLTGNIAKLGDARLKVAASARDTAQVTSNIRPRKAPLMQKTLQLMKGRFKR